MANEREQAVNNRRAISVCVCVLACVCACVRVCDNQSESNCFRLDGEKDAFSLYLFWREEVKQTGTNNYHVVLKRSPLQLH